MTIHFNEKLINILSESFCPNDLLINDFTNPNECNMSTKEKCKECWIEALERLERPKRFLEYIEEANKLKNQQENTLPVKCTDCQMFRLDDESIPYCAHEDECNIENPEDQDRIENRPMFTKKGETAYESIF